MLLVVNILFGQALNPEAGFCLIIAEQEVDDGGRNDVQDGGDGEGGLSG